MTSPASRKAVGAVEASRLDAILVERVRVGEAAAFERLFLTYYPSLCGFVDTYVHSEAIAEELVSDLFRRLWEQRERWTPTTSVASYLFGAARNCAIDYLKHQRVEQRVWPRVPRRSGCCGPAISGP